VWNIVAACKEEGVNATIMVWLMELMKRVVEEHGGDVGVTGVGKQLLGDIE